MEEFALTKEEAFKRTASERKAIKTEFNRPSFKELLEREKGKKCVCCGSTLCVEYHHILPICLGGDNRLSNIQPVCNSCHKLIHGGRVNKLWRADNKGGRKRIPPVRNYKSILEKYFRCEIGKNECCKLLKVNGQTKLNDRYWFKEYKQEQGIVQYRNNIDIITANSEMHENREAGYITYKDGSTMVFNTNTYIQTHKEYKQLFFV